MTGRGRGRRTAAKEAPKSPARRGRGPHFDDAIDPQITQASQEDMASQEMPPPPVPTSPRATRSLRSRDTKDANVASAAAPIVVPSRRAAPLPVRGASEQSLSSASTTEIWEDPQESRQNDMAGDDFRSEDSSVRFRRNPGKKAKLLESLLPTLLQSAQNVYSHLLAPSTAPEDDAEWFDDLEVKEGILNSTREHYLLRSAAPFIDTKSALEKMGSDAGSEAWQHGSRITVLANIASLLADLANFNNPQKPKKKLTLLQTLDAWFPKAFIPDMGLNCVTPNIVVHNVHSIRQNRLFLTIQECPGEEKIKMLCEIFLEDTVPEQLQEFYNTDQPLTLRTIDGLDWNQYDDLRNSVTEQVWLLYGMLLDLDPSGLTQLQEHVAENTLTRDLKNFATKAFEELLAQERAPDQMPSIERPTPLYSSPAPAPASQRLPYESQATPMGSQASSVHHAIPQSMSQSGLDDLADLAQMQTLKRTAERAQQDYALSHDDLLTVRRSSEASSYPGPPGNQYTMYAYPPPASEYPTSGSIFAESAARSLKRGAPEDASDFETDNRVHEVKRQKTSRPRKSRAKSAASRASMRSEEPLYTPPRMDGPLVDLDAVSSQSRMMSALHRKPKAPQTRTPWSRNDCRLLIRAVGTYECKWSQIEDNIKTGMIRLEHPRDQQALRDKARLLKQDFLKTDSPLPPGFDLVVLGKKEKMAVIACGKNPDRKESDVGPDGTPTNTEYIDPAELARQAEADPTLQAQSEPANGAELQAQNESQIQSESQIQHELQVQTELQMAAELQSQSEAQNHPALQAQTQLHAQFEQELQPNAELQPEPVMQSKPEMQPEPIMQPEHVSIMETNSGEDADGVSETAESVATEVLEGQAA